MKEIAVTGGKGGVGKSTVAVLLAGQMSKREKVVLVDADVECPNDHLLIGKKLSKPVKQVFAFYPKLIKEKCRKCGLCAEKCRFKAIFAPVGEYPKFLNDLCANCGLCWNICPYQAIKKVKKPIGDIFEFTISNQLTLITGLSKSEVDETGPIVRELRAYSRKKAEELKADKIIIDTAPGTHCSVINALLKVDQVIAVTEPTPLGRHDLKVITEVIEKLELDYQVVVNQANLGNLDLIKKNIDSSKIIAEIPHCQKIIEGYINGKLLELDSHRVERCLKKI